MSQLFRASRLTRNFLKNEGIEFTGQVVRDDKVMIIGLDINLEEASNADANNWFNTKLQSFITSQEVKDENFTVLRRGRSLDVVPL